MLQATSSKHYKKIIAPIFCDILAKLIEVFEYGIENGYSNDCYTILRKCSECPDVVKLAVDFLPTDAVERFSAIFTHFQEVCKKAPTKVCLI